MCVFLCKSCFCACQSACLHSCARVCFFLLLNTIYACACGHTHPHSQSTNNAQTPSTAKTERVCGGAHTHANTHVDTRTLPPPPQACLHVRLEPIDGSLTYAHGGSCASCRQRRRSVKTVTFASRLDRSRKNRKA